MHVPSKQERHNSMLIWTNWICLCLLGSESFICNNHNSWAKVNGQGDMQTCCRQNVVSSKSIAIVYHSFKLDYIAFFLDDVREFCENLKGPWCILQSKSNTPECVLFKDQNAVCCLVSALKWDTYFVLTTTTIRSIGDPPARKHCARLH